MAALPPDVRKGYAFPAARLRILLLVGSRLSLEPTSISSNFFRPVSQSPTRHRAPQPLSLTNHFHLTYKSLNESAHRLVDPLLHLGIDVALHQTRPGRSSTTHIRRHPFRACLVDSQRDDSRAWSSLAAH